MNGDRRKLWEGLAEVKMYLLAIAQGISAEEALDSEKLILEEALRLGVEFDLEAMPISPVEKSYFLMELDHKIRLKKSGLNCTNNGVVISFTVPNNAFGSSGINEETGEVQRPEERLVELIFQYDFEKKLKRSFIRTATRKDHSSVEFSEEEGMVLEQRFNIREMLEQPIHRSSMSMHITQGK